jgi:predicted nuclease of predicted toxin-antitoxin system
MPTLLERIGNRTVLIDANLPNQLAEVLRKKGLSVRHVNEIDRSMRDTHIQIIMYDSDVLLTKDREFRFKLSKSRAILIKPWKTKDQLLAMVG